MAITRKTPSTFQQYKALLRKDISRELRTKEMLSSMGIYAILVLIVYGAALSQVASSYDVLQIAPGLLWVLIVFTSLLGLNRSFSYERENACLEGILLIPMDRSVIFLAKATSNMLFLFLVEIIAVPVFYFFFLLDQNVAASAPLVIAPLVLGTIGMAGIGTLLSTITVSTSGKDVLLAVLMIPLIFPLLYACVSATSAVLLGGLEMMDVLIPSLILATVYDIVMTLASWVLYEFVVSV